MKNNILVISYVPLNVILEKILFLNFLKNKYNIYYCYMNFNISKKFIEDVYVSTNIKKYEFKNIYSFKKFMNNFSPSNTVVNLVRLRNLDYIRVIKYIKIKKYFSFEYKYILPYINANFHESNKEKLNRLLKKYLNYNNYLIYLYEKIYLNKHIFFSNFDLKNCTRINYFDVENNINLKPRSLNLKKSYVLFLDSHIHDGSDSKFDDSIRVDTFSHYKLTNKFIEKIEYVFKQEVIISGHPKYKNSYNGLFKSKKIYFDYNKELIENASYVLCFDSSAVYYAIFKLKKIIFLYSNEIKRTSTLKHNKFGSIKIHSDLLSAQIFNMNDYDNLNINSFISNVNIEKYDKFIKKYLFLNSISSFELIDKEIKKILI